LLLLPATAGADPADDAQVVYCLAPAHRPDLINAAQSLGVAVPSNPSQLPAWRNSAPADFDRACQALYAADGKATASTSVVSTLLPFLTGLFSAVLAFLAAFWWNRVNRGTALADELRVAVAAFHIAGIAYLTAGANRDEDSLRAARRILIGKLARLRAEHRAWTVLGPLHDDLNAGELSKAKLGVDWDVRGQRQREQLKRLIERFDEIRDTGERLAAALGRPLRPHPELRGPGGPS
ncbi:MAG TPA: hypothetical protein VHZ97_00205, partial [Pseudonocardiaceae bacterium]|nr:hypothetical protein [Pseudonocardiaceae bacterium]